MRQQSRWRDAARRTLSEVSRTLPADADLPTVRRAFSKAYPFGHRRQWPYKVWLLEVRGFIAVRFPEVERERRAKKRKAPPLPADAAQMSLFDGEVQQ